MNLSNYRTGPFRVEVTNLDDGENWKLVGIAESLTVTQEADFGTIYSDYSPYVAQVADQGYNVTIEAKLTAQTLKIVTGGALELPEAEGSAAVKRLKEILS